MALQTTMMDALGTIMRPTIRRDSVRGTTQTPMHQVATNVPCSIQEVSEDATVVYGERRTRVATVAYFTSPVDIKINDQLITVDRHQVTTKFNVIGQLQYLGRGVLWKAVVEQLG